MDISNIKEDLEYEPEYDYISYLKDYKKKWKHNVLQKNKNVLRIIVILSCANCAIEILVSIKLEPRKEYK